MYFKDLDISFHYPVNHVTYCRAPEEDLYLKQPEIHFFNFLFLRMKFILKSVLHFKKKLQSTAKFSFCQNFLYFFGLLAQKMEMTDLQNCIFFILKGFFYIKNKKEHAAVILDMSVSDLKDDSKLMSTLKNK